MSEAIQKPAETVLLAKGSEAGVKRLPQHTLSEMLVAFNFALDLAEGREPGHAQRVAYLAVSIAEELGLQAEQRLACCYGGLMHDIGAIVIGAELAQVTRGDERLLLGSLPLMTPEEVAIGAADSPELVVERIVDHSVLGSRAAAELGLPEAATQAVAQHHENWDRSGYPYGLAAEEISLPGRIVAVADHVEALISQSSPLMARRSLTTWVGRLHDREADPSVASALRALGAGDSFWLGLFSTKLPSEIAARCGRMKEPKAARLMPSVETLAKLVDSRFSFTVGVSTRVARLAESIRRSLGLAESKVKRLRLAVPLHDVGQLAVSERVMAKPGILSVEELEILRMHPTYSRDTVSAISGLGEVAEWLAAHHERPDGRGYPDGRTGQEIPLEARILAVADAYVAITSDRPHRPKAGRRDAETRLRAAAGGQIDSEIVEVFLGSGLAA